MSTAETDAQIINPEMPDVPPHAPSKINLKDYKKPSFDVETVDLDIKLFEEYAQVDSTLKMVRQTAGNIVLFGEELELLAITMNGRKLSDADYQQQAGKLTITATPDELEEITLEIQVRICPQTNTALEGLYMAGSGDDTMFVTQCEPEGFRKINFYPDRPDVLAIFTTRLEADKRYPTLLANGNLVEAGEVAELQTVIMRSGTIQLINQATCLPVSSLIWMY
jgi:aminopeptidase N